MDDVPDAQQLSLRLAEVVRLFYLVHGALCWYKARGEGFQVVAIMLRLSLATYLWSCPAPCGVRKWRREDFFQKVLSFGEASRNHQDESRASSGSDVVPASGGASSSEVRNRGSDVNRGGKWRGRGQKMA